MSKMHPWTTAPNNVNPIVIKGHGKSLIDEEGGVWLYVRGNFERLSGMESCLIH